MKDRLRQFMVLKSVSAADLADRIGVQRSNVSHILNGRNNPGSQFIEKLLKAFPDLNAGWLMTGIGEMVIPVNQVKQQEPDATLFSPQPVQSAAPKPEKTISQQITPPIVPPVVATGKKIEKIVFFYQDKSFTEFHPEG